MKRSMYRVLLTITALALVASLIADIVVESGAGGVEFNIVSVWVPSNLYGQLGVFALPFNVSDPALLSYSNMYIIDEGGAPYFSYLFSSTPPLAVWVDAAISSKTYSIFYGGANPYPERIAAPGNPDVPLFAAYDDFDYDSGMWVYTGPHTISQSILSLTGRMNMNVSYTPGVYALWLIRFGSYGTVIQLYSPTGYEGWVYLRLDASNFADWGSIRDGSDIYFTDSLGEPLYYWIPYLNKTEPRADIFIYVDVPAGSARLIHMFYGRDNPYPDYRVNITYPIKAVDITPRPPAPLLRKNTYMITGYNPVNAKPVVINLTNVQLDPGDDLIPHLYSFYFTGIRNSYIKIEHDGKLNPEKKLSLYTRYKLVLDGRSAIYAVVKYNSWSYTYGSYFLIVSRYNDKYAPVVFITNGTTGGYVRAYNGTDYIECVDGYVFFVFDSGTTYFDVNGTVITGTATIDSLNQIPHYPLTISSVWTSAYEVFHGYISSVLIWSEINTWNERLDLIKKIIDTKPTLFLEPTITDGKSIFDPYHKNVYKITEENVFRVPDNETWIWVIKHSVNDGTFIHFKYFPRGTLIKIVDVTTGKLKGIVYVEGEANGANLVPDLWFPLTSGTYNITVYTYVTTGSHYETGSTSAWTGLALYTNEWPYVPQDETVRTADGGTIYFEYIGTDYVVAWYQPPPYASLTKDYILEDENGYTPFLYWNTMFSTSGLKLLSAGWQPIHLVTNITVDNNKIIIAPHLFDWYLDGADYIEVPHNDVFNTQTFTIIVFVRNTDGLNNWESIISKGGYDVQWELYAWFGEPHFENHKVRFTYWNGTNYFIIDAHDVAYPNRWIHIAVPFDNGWRAIYINGTKYVESTREPIAYSTAPIKIGIGNVQTHFHGYIGFTCIYSRTLNGNEIMTGYNEHVINAKDLAMFLDPTFFNGTHYIDLSPYGNHGVSYGDVKRVEAEEKWLWVLVNSTESGNIVVFRWFPENSIAIIRDATTGDVVTTVAIPSGETGTYIKLPSGNYTVETIIYPSGMYRVITQTFTIDANDVFAPHIYDWWFGIGGFIDINVGGLGAVNDTNLYILASRFYFIDNPSGKGTPRIFSTTGDNGYASLLMTVSGASVFMVHRIYSPVSEYIGAFVSYAGDWDEVVGYVDYNAMTVNATASGGSSYSEIHGEVGTIHYGSIGSWESNVNTYVGYISYAIMYKGYYISRDDIISRSIPSDGLTVLFDATFFNGTHYLDLVSERVGRPRGGNVSRVLATNMWLWQVKGLADDGNVHFRFFPKGTIIRIYWTSGILRWVFYIDGPTNAAGLVEDYAVKLAPGTYIIEAIIPIWGGETSITENLNAGVSFSGARDGYVASLAFDIDTSIVDDGLMNVSLVVSPAMFGTDTVWNAPQYHPLFVWGSVPGYNATGFDTGLSTVIEARLYASSGWNIVFFNMTRVGSSLFPWCFGDLSPVLAVYGYHGDVYLYYGPDDAMVDTGLEYNESTWIYVYVEFQPNGNVIIGAGPGNYGPDGIYEKVYTYTYVPSNWSPMFVAWGVGVFARESGSHTLYIDWMRVRSSATTFTVSTADRALWYSTEEYLTYNGTSGNWTMFIDMADAEAFKLFLYGVNGTYTIECNDILDAMGSAYSYVGVSTTGKLNIYNGSTILASVDITVPIDETLIVMYNGTSLSVGLFTNNTYTELVAVPLTNESFYPLAKLILAKRRDTTSVTERYVADKLAGFNMFESASQTVLPSVPGAENVYRFGYFFNTTVGNATYMAEWGVLINGTSVELFVDENGSITTLDLGVAKTPMIVGVGYEYENTTRRLTVYAMLVWSESVGGRLVTRYKWRFVDVTVNENMTIDGATVFAEASEEPLLVDRFGLVLGWLMSQIVRGNILVTISGYYPVGGLIKYVSVAGPIKIKLSGGDIVVEPATAEEGTIVLEGFKGWSLDLAIYGTSVTGIMIPSDSYAIDFPVGFTAVIVADISARKISIVSASPPPLTGGGKVPQGSNLAVPVMATPRFTHAYAGPNQLADMIILAGTLVAASIVASRLTGNVGDGVAITGIIATIIFLAIGDYLNMSLAILAIIVGVATKKALTS